MRYACGIYGTRQIVMCWQGEKNRVTEGARRLGMSGASTLKGHDTTKNIYSHHRQIACILYTTYHLSEFDQQAMGLPSVKLRPVIVPSDAVTTLSLIRNWA